MMRISSLLIQEAPWHRVVVAAFRLVRSLNSLIENGGIGAIISVAADVPGVKWVRDLAFRDGLGFGLVESLERGREGERQRWYRWEIEVETTLSTNTRGIVARVPFILAVTMSASANENRPPEQTDDEAYGS